MRSKSGGYRRMTWQRGGYNLSPNRSNLWFDSTARDHIPDKSWVLPLSTPPILMWPSSNIAASGEATTAQLTAPAGKTTSDFTAGRIQDDENPTDAVDIVTSDYTELEWALRVMETAVDAATYEFRIVRADGTILDTYTVTPQLTVTSGVTVTPGTLALAFTFFAPTVSTPRVIVPPALALAFTFFAPSIILGTRVVPPPLALAFTFFAPTVSTPRLVVPPALALSFTFFAPTVSVGGGQVIVPPPLTLAFTFFAPTVSTPRVVTPPVLALSFTFFAPTVSTPRLVVPPTLALTMTFFAPTVSTPRVVTPGTLALAFTFFAPTVSVGGALTVTPGTLALAFTFFAPTVSTLAAVELTLFRRRTWEQLAAATNLVTNPSFEVNATGWSGLNGGSISRVADQRAIVGRYVGRVTVPGVSVGEGAIFARMIVNPNTAYVFTLYVKEEMSFHLAIDEYTAGDAFLLRTSGPTSTGSYHSFGRYRVAVTTGAATGKVDVIVRTAAVQAGVFDIDAAQLELGVEPSPYIDGDRGEGITWGGTAHASQSTRPAMALRGDGAGQHWVLEQVP